MSFEAGSDAFGIDRFGIGQAVPRTEDPLLVTGKGQYTDDLSLPGQAHAAIVRSTHAHGILNGIDATAALAMPGVLAIYTGADFEAAGYGALRAILNFPNADGTPQKVTPRKAFALDRVRFQGDPVAVVVAETAMQARDAAEAVVVDIEPLPAVVDIREAVKPGAPQLYDTIENNIVLDYLYGDKAQVEAAFARAAHVVKLDLDNNRLVVNPMEPRSAIGEIADGRWVLHVCSQGVFGLRNQLANDILKVKPDQVRVRTYNVGGSFGMKIPVYPEYVAVLHAAKMLGRPVKWTDDRSGAFLSDQHGRDHWFTGELALDAKGRFLAARFDGLGNLGGFCTTVGAMMPTLNIAKNAVSLYRLPAILVTSRCVVTNTQPIGAYRGAGRPEGNYFMERLIEAAALKMGMDPIKLRKVNQITPAEIPYASAGGTVYDTGDFEAILNKAIEVSDWDGFKARRAASKKAGKLRGRGVGCFLEVTAPANKEMGGLRFEADGTVTIITGTLDYGQGHAAPFAQVLAAKLGIPFDRIRLLQGDSDEMLAGGGTGGSRSIMNSGGAIIEASGKVVEKGTRIAAALMETAEADIEFRRGRFVVAGTDRSLSVMEVADKLRAGAKLPEGVPTSLDVSLVYDGVPSAFPNGCHICEVEIDPQTGVTRVDRYVSVNDFGTLINPMLVEGQCHGGIVQGIGQALYERTVYDDNGQLLTGSFMDYCMPRADDVPNFGFVSHPVPAKTNPLGAKGCGEAGCAGSLPAVMNAVVDALSVYGITHIQMPATPEVVWRAIREASAKPAA
jgi:aerobic carbon-monoxide dehydrogenase large subunit